MISDISRLVQEVGIFGSIILALFFALWWILNKKEASSKAENEMAQQDRNALNERIDSIIMNSQKAMQEQQKICSEEISELRKVHSAELSEIRKYNFDLQSKFHEQISMMNDKNHALQKDYMTQTKEMNEATNLALNDLTKAINRMMDYGKSN